MYHPESEPPMPVHEKDGWGCSRMLLLVVLFGIASVYLFGRELNNRRRALCKNLLVEIDNAIKSYRQDADAWPMEITNDDWSGTTEGEAWIYLLMGSPGSTNEYIRRVNYLEGFAIAEKSNNGKWTSGIDVATDPHLPRILDAWGNYCRVQVDGNGDGKLIDPKTNQPRQSVCLVWSAGPDGDFATWDDNVCSW